MHIVCMNLQAKSVQIKHRSALYSLRNDGSKLFINLLPKQLKLVISSKKFKRNPLVYPYEWEKPNQIYLFSLLIVFHGSHSFQSYFMKTDGPEYKI